MSQAFCNKCKKQFAGEEPFACLHCGETKMIFRFREDFEEFHYFFLCFDVIKARQIIAESPGREITMFAPTNPEQCMISVYPEYAMSDIVDPTMPCILATWRDKKEGIPQQVPIDGWHRLYKAFKLGIPAVPFYILNESETWQIVKDRDLAARVMRRPLKQRKAVAV